MLKRALDIFVAALGLVVLSPLLVAIGLLVRWKLGSPVLFTQTRPGLGGQPFQLVKFRTMTDARDLQGSLLPDADRLTSFGRMLRASSLDELPELWNVLKGEMSLVGPRPLLMDYLPLYSSRQARRNEMRPGITGLAQISGRNGISWDQKFELDVWYIDNWSMRLDLQILMKTLVAVVRRKGITGENSATAERFTGNRPLD